jgi:hypothetical protein
MDKGAQLSELTRRVRRATSATDWSALGVLDHEIAHLLRWMPGGPWKEQERTALAELRSAHAEARERCGCEAARVEEVLLHMRLHRDGWMAYAMNVEQDEARP